MKHRIPALLFLLPAILCTGCTAALLPPTPAELLSYETGSFVCAFTAEDDGIGTPVILVRDKSGDTMTVTEPHSRVVFRFAAGQTLLVTQPSPEEASITVPLTLPNDHGVGAWQPLFCTAETEDMTVSRTEDGWRLDSAPDKSPLSLYFSDEKKPVRLERDGIVLNITEFTITEGQEP